MGEILVQIAVQVISALVIAVIVDLTRRAIRQA
jgi:hypothetical protein